MKVAPLALVPLPALNARATASPAVTVICCVATVKPAVEKVKVYVVPATPRIPRSVNVAKPRSAATLVVPRSCPPEPEVIATLTVEVLRSTRFPCASLIETCGWVVNSAPLCVPAL